MAKILFYHILPSLTECVQLVTFVVASVTVEPWSGCTFALIPPPSSSLGRFVFFIFFNLLPFLTSTQFSLPFLPSPETLTLLLLPPPSPLNPPQFLFSSAYTLLFLSKVPFALIPSASLWPESSLSVVVPRFDICVYLATACTAGSQTDRVGLNKERKLGKGNTHALRHIHKSWNACWSGPTITALFFTCRTSCVPELGLGTKQPSGSFFFAHSISYCNPTHWFMLLINTKGIHL